MFLIIAAVGRGHGVVSLAVKSLAITVAKGGAAYVIARRAEPGLRLGFSLVTRATLRRTMSYGSFVGGLRLLSVVYSQMDRAIIAIVVTVAAVSRYEVAFRVQSIATLVLVMSSSAVLPAAAYNAARGDVAKQRELFLRGSKYAVALVVPVTLAALVYARALIINWVGDDYAAMATATRVFLVLPMLSCVNQVGVTMLIGLGYARRVLVLQAMSVGVNLVASIALAFPLGVTGVVVGTVIGTAIVWIPYIHLQLQTFDVGLWEWTQRVIVPNAGGAFAQLLFGIATLAWATHLDSLAAVAIVCVLACAINAGVFVTLGLARDERRHLISRLLLR
jgi:O-antigen/teichoic acid export membrane protein